MLWSVRWPMVLCDRPSLAPGVPEACARGADLTRDRLLVRGEQSALADDHPPVDDDSLRAGRWGEHEAGERVCHARMNEVVDAEQRHVGTLARRQRTAVVASEA